MVASNKKVFIFSLKSFILTGIVAYFFFLAVQIPAVRVWKLASNHIPEVEISGLDGTVWNGSASGIVYKGLPVRNLRWNFTPWALLYGRLQFRFHVQADSVEGAGKAFATPLLNFYLADCDFDLQGRGLNTTVKRYIRDLPLWLNAKSVTCRMEEIGFEGRTIKSVTGGLVINGLSSGDIKLTESFVIDFESDREKKIRASFSGAGSGLLIKGAMSLDGGNKYDIQADIRVKPGFDSNAGSLIRGMTRPGRDGGRLFKAGGRIRSAKPWFEL